MRVAALLAPVVLILAGAGYYISKPGAYAAIPRETPMPERHPLLDDPADARDAALVRDSINNEELTERQKYILISAAGRRYMRRKLLYEDVSKAAGQGKGDATSLPELKEDMDQARRICDLAESLGRHSRELLVTSRAGTELERLLWLSGPSRTIGLADKFVGGGPFTEADLARMDNAFRTRFGRPLPVSTRGASTLHRAMGFDHRGRFDVAVVPENVEGVWVRNYLSAKNVSFYAFRSVVPGRATGAHIHIGPASGRLHND